MRIVIASLVSALTLLNAVSADASAVSLTQADLYVFSTSASGTEVCDRLQDVDRSAVVDLVRRQLRVVGYTTAVGATTGPDPLHAYPVRIPGQNPINHVLVATVCKTGDIDNISIAGYALSTSNSVDATPATSGSVAGTFDSLESADWSNVFGTAALFPNVAFIPIVNDTTNVINPRLQRNLPLTVIATPAPAPIAPPPPGAPAPPQPPTTRLGECRASAYKMLIIGRTTTSSTSTDVTRGIVAASALKLFTQPAPWSTVYSSVGVLFASLYDPTSSEASVDMFSCGPNDDHLEQIGGLNHHITGWKRTALVGVDPFGQQRTLDLAAVDLANQLDCIIYWRLGDMGILSLNDLAKARQSIYPKDDLATSPWCAGDAGDPVDSVKKYGDDTKRIGYYAYLMHLHPAVPVLTPINIRY